jgi:large subunit ribosomal protein L9
MLGLHDVVVRLHPEVDVKITLNVARSEDEAQAQARGEDVNAPKDEEEFDMGDINELLGEDDDLDADEEGDEDL